MQPPPTTQPSPPPDAVLLNTLLSLVSRAAAVVSEMLRLADHVEQVKKLDTNFAAAWVAVGTTTTTTSHANTRRQTHGNITNTTGRPNIFFLIEEYFADPERKEAAINQHPDAVEMDEAFLTTHAQFLRRFYFVIVGVQKLAKDFARVCREIKKGAFMSHSTLEQVLLDPELKQLFPEAMHGLGMAMLTLDKRFPGPFRERMLIAFYRTNRAAPMFDHVVELAKDKTLTMGDHAVTLSSSKRSEMMLKRLHVDPSVARVVVARLQAEDVYGQIRAWPSPETRSCALASQAAIMYVALLFAEGPTAEFSTTTTTTATTASKSNSILTSGRSEMREIVDRYWSDTWIVVLSLGHAVDLEHEWAAYPAAHAALRETLNKSAALALANSHLATKTQAKLNEYLLRGVMTERFVTENWGELLETLRDANAGLRWSMLHRASVTATTHHHTNKLSLLLSTAQLELLFKEAVKRVLQSKRETWLSCRGKATERLMELARYFSGDGTLLSRAAVRDEELMSWLEGLAHEVSVIDYDKTPTASGRRIQVLIEALEEVERFEGVESSLQVREFLADSRALLHRMLRTVSVRDELLATIEIVSDAWYLYGESWDEEVASGLQKRVEEDPHCVVALRAVFIKLGSVLDMVLARPAQCGSLDVDSIAEYWSGCLAVKIRKALDVIPRVVFGMMVGGLSDEVEALNTEVTSVMEGQRGDGYRVPVDRLGYFAAGEHRYRVSLWAYKLAVLIGNVIGDGALIQLGVEKIDFGKVLQEGLQRCLRERMIETMMTSSTGLDKLHRVWIWCQDLFGLKGEVVWQQQLRAACAMNQDALMGMSTTIDKLWTILGKQGIGNEVCEALLCEKINDEIASLVRVVEKGPRHKPLPMGDGIDLAFEWVEAVRQARRSYSFFTRDIALLDRIGKMQELRMKLRGDGKWEDAAVVGAAAAVDAIHLFVVVNELCKRCVAEGKTVWGDWFHVVVGIASCLRRGGCHYKFRQVCLRDVKGLSLRAAHEDRVAEGSVFGGFGSAKVAKTAFQRLRVEVEFLEAIEGLMGGGGTGGGSGKLMILAGVYDG